MTTITAKTRVCGIFGHPVGHSLSPEIHNAAFTALGLPYVYVAHDVQPGCVARALDGIRVMGYRGLSVTIPHKVEAMAGVDEVDETARIIGCINTVVNENGRLLGYNSDGRGAVNALCEAGHDPRGRRDAGRGAERPGTGALPALGVEHQEVVADAVEFVEVLLPHGHLGRGLGRHLLIEDAVAERLGGGDLVVAFRQTDGQAARAGVDDTLGLRCPERQGPTHPG